VRQDYLDDLIWKQVVQMLEDPQLIQAEIDHRIHEIQDSKPTLIRKETLLKELTRTRKGIDHLLDAYQESLLPLEELRKRIPHLRKKEASLKAELQTLETKSVDQEKYRELRETLEGFLNRLRESAASLDVLDRQRILRLVVKEILVGPETLTIKHSIPVSGSTEARNLPGYLLCGRSQGAALRCSLPRRLPRLVSLHTACFKIVSDQIENPRIHNLPLQHPYELTVRNPIKEAFNVGF
jgi:site-specific DNA recombinase